MSKRVLIVDDDQNNTKYLSTILKEHGYTPLAAGDGAEGLKVAGEEKPDLIVLDVMMPRKSGFNVFVSLKKDEELKGIPVIMLTAINDVIEDGKDKSEDETFEQMKDFYLEKMEKLVGKFRDNGDVKPEMFLDKPVEPDKFAEAVTSLIGH